MKFHIVKPNILLNSSARAHGSRATSSRGTVRQLLMILRSVFVVPLAPGRL